MEINETIADRSKKIRRADQSIKDAALITLMALCLKDGGPVDREILRDLVSVVIE